MSGAGGATGIAVWSTPKWRAVAVAWLDAPLASLRDESYVGGA